MKGAKDEEHIGEGGRNPSNQRLAKQLAQYSWFDVLIVFHHLPSHLCLSYLDLSSKDYLSRGPGKVGNGGSTESFCNVL